MRRRRPGRRAERGRCSPDADGRRLRRVAGWRDRWRWGETGGMNAGDPAGGADVVAVAPVSIRAAGGGGGVPRLAWASGGGVRPHMRDHGSRAIGGDLGAIGTEVNRCGSTGWLGSFRRCNSSDGVGAAIRGESSAAAAGHGRWPGGVSVPVRLARVMPWRRVNPANPDSGAGRCAADTAGVGTVGGFAEWP